jgi:hypothetical protein
MQLLALALDGSRHTPALRVDDLEDVASLPSPPAGTSVADALSLLAAALDPSLVLPTLASLGLRTAATEVTVAAGLTDEVAQLDPAGVDALCIAAPPRHLVIDALLRPDPPLYGMLSAQAGRDPRMVSALRDGGHLGVKVGWLFNRAGTVASVSLLSIRIGEVAFSLDPKERPAWLPDLCHQLASRVRRVAWHVDAEQLAAAWHDAATSPDREVRSRYALACDDLLGPPFHLPPVQLVRHEGRPALAFGEDLLPARLLGPAALRALRLVHAARVLAPDVLIVELEAPDPQLRAWLEGCVRGPRATQEQVLLVGVGA